MKSALLGLGLVLFLLPFLALADVVINEVMYDLEGSDTIGGRGREWVEIFNDSSQEINLSGWKFNDGDSATNHGLNEPPAGGGQGSLVISANGYAILAVDALTFLLDHQNYNGTIIDILGVNSLNNTGAILKLLNSEIVEIYSVTYATTTGANGDGKSLQKINEVWVAANSTPGAVNSGQPSQQQTSTSTPSAPEPTSDVGSGSWPVEPQIYANAGKDKTVIVGADIYFSGQAAGLKKEPLEGVRFLWNFGDGAFKEGQNISHVYKYPGEYIVALDVSSGKYSASDYALVKAVPSQLKISEANKDFIKLSNESNSVLDISEWYLKAGDKLFKLPASTLIKANSTLIIPSSNSGLEAGNNAVAELLYPNASLANFYTKPRETTSIADSKGKEEIKEEIKENTSTPQSQIAGVITIDKNDFWTPKKWLGLVAVLAIFSIIGFLFIRHKTTVPKL